MSVTGGILAGVGLAGSIGGAAIGANAAGNAASTQANAAEQNAQLQAELGQESLGYENYQYQQALANEMPWLQGGANSEATLQYLLGIGGIPGQQGARTGAQTIPGQTLSIPGVQGAVNLPGVSPLQGTAATNLGAYGSLMSQYPGGQFTAPTLEQAQQAPGYQFGLQQGIGALQAGAAANGSLLTGGTQNALDQYAQNYADTNYNNVYNQALQGYQTNYNVWANQQANEFNRLAALAGGGQTAAQQLNSAGLQSAGQVANTLMGTGQGISQQNSNAAAATASGYIGAGNAWGGALSGGANNLSQLALLYNLMNSQGGSVPTAGLNIYNGMGG